MAEARRRADKQRGKVAGGADPQGETAAKRKAPTLSVLIDRYLEEAVAPHKRAATLALYKMYLRKMIEPAMGSRRAATTTRNETPGLLARYYGDVHVGTIAIPRATLFHRGKPEVVGYDAFEPKRTCRIV